MSESKEREESPGDLPDFRIPDIFGALKIDVGTHCPITRQRAEILDVEKHLIDGVCHISVVTNAEADIGISHFEKPLEGECVGRIFTEYGAVPKIVEVDGTSLIVTAFFEDTDSLSSIVSELTAAGFGVDLKVLKDISDRQQETSESVCLCSPSRLTEKERKAVDVALAAGYYDLNAKCDLAEIAAELHIGKSAVSKRLRSAESKIMQEVFEMDSLQ